MARGERGEASGKVRLRQDESGPRSVREAGHVPTNRGILLVILPTRKHFESTPRRTTALDTSLNRLLRPAELMPTRRRRNCADIRRCAEPRQRFGCSLCRLPIGCAKCEARPESVVRQYTTVGQPSSGSRR